MSGSKLAIDTNVAVQLLNGDAAVSHRVQSFDEILLPAPVLGELRFGAAKSSRSAANHARVDALQAACRLLPVDATTCAAYADVRLALRRSGTPIPENDVWIAAACIEHGFPLASLDGHMSCVTGHCRSSRLPDRHRIAAGPANTPLESATSCRKPAQSRCRQLGRNLFASTPLPPYK